MMFVPRRAVGRPAASAEGEVVRRGCVFRGCVFYVSVTALFKGVAPRRAPPARRRFRRRARPAKAKAAALPAPPLPRAAPAAACAGADCRAAPAPAARWPPPWARLLGSPCPSPCRRAAAAARLHHRNPARRRRAARSSMIRLKSLVSRAARRAACHCRKKRPRVRMSPPPDRESTANLAKRLGKSAAV